MSEGKNEVRSDVSVFPRKNSCSGGTQNCDISIIGGLITSVHSLMLS